ncbi:hypothetical protein KCP76_06200 [Salmonella enterica subsp. enterica serovar Weltevreden]|nr:hypothetical protein KCP76_06200 [Salmonella enterica subsp. enterica serovar Weltevreden]
MLLPGGRYYRWVPTNTPRSTVTASSSRLARCFTIAETCALSSTSAAFFCYAAQLVHGASQAGKPICLFLRRLADPCDKQATFCTRLQCRVHGTACGEPAGA